MLDTYDAMPGLRWSRLKNLRTSPKLYRHELEHGRKDTAALARGRAAHAALYYPDTFGQQITVYPGPARRGKKWDEFADYHKGADIVTMPERDLALAIADAVRYDRVAGPLLEGSYVEQAITWEDEITGQTCKGRVDQVNGRLGDLKTCSEKPLLTRFPHAVEKYGYLGQLAFYSDGLRANGLEVSDLPVLIAVESAPPHDVIVFEVSEEDLDAGRQLYRQLMQRLIVCEKMQEWHGQAGGEMVKLRRPAWAVADDEDVELKMGGEPLTL